MDRILDLPAANNSILCIHQMFLGRNFDVAEVSRLRYRLGGSRLQRLNIVDQTHLELACGMFALQKIPEIEFQDARSFRYKI